MLKRIAAIAAATILAMSASAVTITYDIAWTGSSGYSMTGQFSFDSSAGTEVRDAEVTALSITVLQNGKSEGSWTLGSVLPSDFNSTSTPSTASFWSALARPATRDKDGITLGPALVSAADMGKLCR